VSLRSGLTTGTCAAAAAKAAAMVLGGGAAPAEVELRLPGGQAVRVPILFARPTGDGAVIASVRKDAGDDDDVTDGMEVRATVARQAAADVTLAAGRGVGTVTKPGLQVPPGQPAINPVPRQMIAAAVREVTADGLRIEISIPGGRRIARKTFNPRLGIRGGLSILGTSGIVRPHCTKALHDALRCALDVAAACGVQAPVFVPGNIGAKAARRHFALRPEQVILAGNAWGFLLDQAASSSPLPLGEGPGVRASLPQTVAGKICSGAGRPHPNPLPEGEGTAFVSPLPLGEGPGVRASLPQTVAGKICSGADCPHPRAPSGTDAQRWSAWSLPEGEGTFSFRAVLLLGHPGKLAKLAAGQWDTHSARSAPATEFLRRVAPDVLGRPVPEVATVEGMLAALGAEDRKTLSDALARQIRLAVVRRVEDRFSVAVFLVNMAGQCLGADGDFSPWR
jgi:cobalt-precorrin-5B (C1)-methyltransferase